MRTVPALHRLGGAGKKGSGIPYLAAQWSLILVRDSVSETVDRSSYRPWVFLLIVGLQDTGPLLFKDTRLTFECVFLRC